MRMLLKPSNRLLRTVLLALFPAAGSFRRSCFRSSCFFCFACFFCCLYSFYPAAGAEPGTEHENTNRVEAVVIHVDEYAVYAPNLIFYFDTRMDKRKIETLKRTANQLRNKKALITYCSSGDFNRNERLLLADIVSASEKTYREKEAKQPDDSQPKPASKLSEDKASLAQSVSSEPNEPARKAAASETGRNRETERFDPITREEISAFIRRLLYLNGRKDLAAVAAFYAERVDYYDRGIVGRDKVLQDLQYYFRNWAQIDTRMDGDVAMAGLEPQVRIAKFICSYSLKNEKKSIVGKSENIWTIQRINGELKLIDVKQKILGN